MKKMYIVPANEVIQIKAGKMMCISQQDNVNATRQTPSERNQVWYRGGDGLAREVIDNPDESEDWDLF